MKNSALVFVIRNLESAISRGVGVECAILNYIFGNITHTAVLVIKEYAVHTAVILIKGAAYK